MVKGWYLYEGKAQDVPDDEHSLHGSRRGCDLRMSATGGRRHPSNRGIWATSESLTAVVKKKKKRKTVASITWV